MADHILHITQVADDEHDDVVWTIDCTGAKTSCEVWYTCAVKDCSIPGPYSEEASPEEEGEEFVTRHGVEHQWIEGDWMTASGRCAAVETDVSEAVWEIAAERGIGDWPVQVDYQGDGMWWLEDLTDVAREPA